MEKTARAFLEYAGYEINEYNLFALTQYVASYVDFSQFPDANVYTEDSESLIELYDEPSCFQEYMNNK
jgi:hypothetical protein